MNPLYPAIIVSSALYLGGVLATSLVRGAILSGDLALLAMGFTYLTFLFQLGEFSQSLRLGAYFGSIFFGIAAGLALLGNL